MIDALRSILGVYTPISYSVDGNMVIPSGFAGVNIEYVVTALIFIIGIYSIFRMVGALIRR